MLDQELPESWGSICRLVSSRHTAISQIPRCAVGVAYPAVPATRPEPPIPVEFRRRFLVSVDQLVVAINKCHDRNGFRCREGEQMPAMRFSGPARDKAIHALPLTEEFTGSRIKPLAQSFKILGLYRPLQSEKFRSATKSAADNAFALRIVITTFQVPAEYPRGSSASQHL